MSLITLIGSILFIGIHVEHSNKSFAQYVDTPMVIHRCSNFMVTGKGEDPQWDKTNWVALTKIDKIGAEDSTKCKTLYSSTGIYVLFQGEDEKLNSAYANDFDNLFNADVFEVFFHPYPLEPVYFEYEISPLEKELILLILNRNGKFGGWTPWHYEGENKVVKKVCIRGGPKQAGASIKGWSAELFFPYSVLNPLLNVPPVSGTRWNANFCRLDYDSGTMVKWSWSPVKASFHETNRFLPVVFE